jgi:hypothetical protein
MIIYLVQVINKLHTCLAGLRILLHHFIKMKLAKL